MFYVEQTVTMHIVLFYGLFQEANDNQVQGKLPEYLMALFKTKSHEVNTNFAKLQQQTGTENS